MNHGQKIIMGSATSDRTLAYHIYRHFGIPYAECEAHYLLDSRKSSLTKQAKRAYIRIWRSIQAAV